MAKQQQPECLKYAGMLGHEYVVVVQTDDPTWPDGWRLLAECPSLRDARRHIEDLAIVRIYRKNYRNKWVRVCK